MTNQEESKSVRVMAWFLHLQRWENPGKFQTNPFEIGNISGFGVLHWGGYLHLKFLLWNTNMPRQIYTQILLSFFNSTTLSFLQASIALISYKRNPLKNSTQKSLYIKRLLPPKKFQCLVAEIHQSLWRGQIKLPINKSKVRHNMPNGIM